MTRLAETQAQTAHPGATVTHANSNQRPFQLRTRAEYTASLPNIEIVPFMASHKLPTERALARQRTQ
jgi:hypothetical protein